MKNTWKSWVGTLAAIALVAGVSHAQAPHSFDAVPVGDPYFSGTADADWDIEGPDVGAVQLGGGGASASAAARPQQPIQQVQATTGGAPAYVEQPFVVPPQVEQPPIFQDAYVPDDSSLGFASTTPLDDIQWRVWRTNLDRMGFNSGYTDLNAFIPLGVEGPNALWWLNPRVHLTDTARGAVSVGLGRRVYVPSEDRVYGASFWWDYDGAHNGVFHQLGGSFESIGRFFSLRGNFVIPVGDPTFDFNEQFANPQFVGNQIAVTRTFSRETAYQVYDFEASMPIPYLGRYGWDVGVGGYYLSSGFAEDAGGVSVRTQVQITEDFWLNTLYTYDHVFGDNLSLNFELTIPNAPPSRLLRRNPVSSYLTASVLRNYRVSVATRTQSETILASNDSGPRAGSPFAIAFIDPNEMDPGDGSMDNPFMSIAEYMGLTAAERARFDLIYVRRREDATDTNLNTTIALLDFQKLIGDGDLPDGSRPTIMTGVGMIELPGTPGALPLLTNSGAMGTPVVTLSNANEVAGFTIDGSGSASGIVGTGIDGFNIHDNVIQNVTNGILITSNTTPSLGTAEDNYGVIVNNQITSSTGAPIASNLGVSVRHSAGTLDLLIADNEVSGFAGEDANGNGVLDPSEDTNMNGRLDVGEDLDFDGILDPAEDQNMNGVLDRGVGIEVVANGGTINANDPANLTRPTGIMNNVLDANGFGISVTANAGTTINASVTDNAVSNGTDPNGNDIEIIADTGTLNLFNFSGNATTGGAGNGLVLINRNGGTLNIGDPMVVGSVFQNNSFTNGGGDGLQIIVDNSTLTIDDLSGFTFSGNADDGLDLRAINGGTLTVTNPIFNSTFTGNGDNGVEITASAGTVDVLFGAASSEGLMGNDFTNNGTNGSGAGLSLNTELNGRINTAIVGNVITGNGGTVTGTGGSGIELNANSGTIDLTGRNATIIDAEGNPILLEGTGIQFNNVTGNAGHGLTITSADGGIIRTPFVADNNFSDNGGASLFIGGSGGTTTGQITLGSVTRNMFNRENSGTAGILFDANDSIINLTLTQNEFIGGNPNTSFGIGGTVDGGGLFLDVGSANPNDINNFSNNVDAHIGITLAGDSVSNIDIINAMFDGATDGPDTQFDGDGVAILLNDTAMLTGSVTRSSFTNNEGDGLRIEMTGNNDAGNAANQVAAALNNFTIGGPGDADGNLFEGNGRDGLSIIRTERGQFNNLTIEGNVLNNNGDHGLFINSAGVNQLNLANMQPDTVTIDNNQITNNATDGVEFRIEADADILANMDGNLIDGNGGNGIQVTEQKNDPRDSRSITGTWTRNIITNNGNDGIQLNGQYGNPANEPFPGAGLLIGDATVNPIGTTSDLGNFIADNGGDGIQITQGGVVTIGNNVITRNGTLGPGDQILNAGINIDGPEFENGTVFVTGSFPSTIDDIVMTGNAFQEITIVSNLITMNNGDGIEWLNERGIDTEAFIVGSRMRVLNNEITQNVGRGVDILNRPGDSDFDDTDNNDPDSDPQFLTTGGNFGDVTIIGNHIKGNRQEGIYVVNTNASDQSQADASNVDLSQNGSVIQDVFLRMDIHGNEIIGNGADVVDFPATGLVVRVGTSGGGFGFTFDGGFATTGFNIEDLDGDGILDNDVNGDGYLNAAANNFAGISMSVTNNNFDGNYGDDILFHSFRSTGDPNTTGGNWNEMEFTPMGFQSDPLARLDLIFTANRFNSAELNNNDVTITPNGEPGAFYNDADGVFKSRLNNIMTTPPTPGPFSSATRRRNAQRQPSRWITGPFVLPPDPLFSPDGGIFLYPGMGNSTFRVRGGQNEFTDQGLGLVTIDQIFILDDPTLAGDPTQVDAFGEAQGVFFTGVNLFGEEPFGWGEF